jgi:hypothetical protein
MTGPARSRDGYSWLARSSGRSDGETVLKALLKLKEYQLSLAAWHQS